MHVKTKIAAVLSQMILGEKYRGLILYPAASFPKSKALLKVRAESLERILFRSSYNKKPDYLG
jgi:hypothetical protein